jgi:hypothetical protein
VKEVFLPEGLLRQLQSIYEKLEQDYSKAARELEFTCTGCPDNCCDSYFLHHTYAEWAFLWLGFRELDPVKQEEILQKSRNYIKRCDAVKMNNKRPQLMCPLNEKGLCALYEHRLLICRTHGVPATLTRPDGQKMYFPGCFRCQELVQKKYNKVPPPSVERTPLLRKLVFLENELLDNRRYLMPKVKITIAEMLVKGPPAVPVPYCQRT